MESRFVRIAVRLGAGLTLAFLYVPLVVVVIYAFNKSVSGAWPPQLFTLKWFSVAWHDPTLKGAFRTSIDRGDLRDVHRVGARHARLVRGAPVRVLRP